MKIKNKSPTHVLYNINTNKTYNKNKNYHQYKNYNKKMKIEKYEIFHLIINEENKNCKIVLGNNLIDTCVNKEKAIQKINKKSWQLILRVIVTIVKSITEKKEE